MYLTSIIKEENVNTSKNMLQSLNIHADFVGYSESNGVSVYFKDENNNKIRISNHCVGNRRMQEELLLSFDERLINLKTKAITIKSSEAINKLNTKNFYNK